MAQKTLVWQKRKPLVDLSDLHIRTHDPSPVRSDGLEDQLIRSDDDTLPSAPGGPVIRLSLLSGCAGDDREDNPIRSYPILLALILSTGAAIRVERQRPTHMRARAAARGGGSDVL